MVDKPIFKVGLVGRYKHGLILEALEKRGWNQGQAAKFVGMSQQQFGRLINMQEVPKRLTLKQEEKFFDLTGHLVDELWPEEIFTERFLESPKKIKAIREVPMHMLPSLGIFSALPPSPDQAVERVELFKDANAVLEALTPRQAEIVRRHVMEEETLESIGESLHISGPRVRQIANKALRRLRHPARSRQLKPYVENETRF